MKTSHQSGVSLIELMIGLVIGLVVAIAAMGSLVYTRTASRVMGDSTRLQQDASTAFRSIGQIVRQAGARQLVDATGGTVSFNPQYVGIEDNASTFQPVAIKGTDGVFNKPDTLVIDRDNTLNVDSADCVGNEVSTGTTIKNTFSVDAGTLKCDGSGKSSGEYGLMVGVEDLQIWYGLREGEGLRYTTASAISKISPAPWDQIEAVRICLRLAGELTNHQSAATLGCQGETIQNDGRLRRAFFRVFKLRNAGL